MIVPVSKTMVMTREMSRIILMIMVTLRMVVIVILVYKHSIET